MILQMFSVHDSKAESFLPPFYFTARGEAVRSFADTCNNPDHNFYKHPGDYTLFALGEFNDQSGEFDPLLSPVSLGLAQEFKQSELPL